MANRAFVQTKGYLEKGMVFLYCNILLGAAGAVTSFVGQGVKSVTRNSAGDYTIVMQDGYVGIKAVSAVIRGTAATGIPTAGKANNVIPYNFVVTNPASFKLACQRSDTQAAADVTDNWFIDVEIELKDSLV